MKHKLHSPFSDRSTVKGCSALGGYAAPGGYILVRITFTFVGGFLFHPVGAPPVGMIFTWFSFLEETPIQVRYLNAHSASPTRSQPDCLVGKSKS